MKLLLFIILLHGLSLSFAKESAEFADKVIQEHELSSSQAASLKKILTSYPGLTRNIGTEDPATVQGPNNSWHPVSRAQCIQDVLMNGLIVENSTYKNVCGAKWMSPVPDQNGNIDNAKVCIDQFEFPNMPCEYPVVWAPASSAKQICESMGKRVCNSHEWEGACAGSTDETDPYLFGLSDMNARRSQYNTQREIIWTYQWNDSLANITDSRLVCGVYNIDDPNYSPGLPLSPSSYFNTLGKSKQCQSGSTSDYNGCGTNSWPAGYKHLCKSQFDVYDMHGNLAEVTNFPRSKSGLANASGNTDYTERKGSFFVYRGNIAKKYPDDCRVRQPYEHFHQISNDKHSYYQEGFRCCKDIR